jgi:hypothetical protein
MKNQEIRKSGEGEWPGSKDSNLECMIQSRRSKPDYPTVIAQIPSKN